jgi:hypothetical protein
MVEQLLRQLNLTLGFGVAVATVCIVAAFSSAPNVVDARGVRVRIWRVLLKCLLDSALTSQTSSSIAVTVSAVRGTYDFGCPLILLSFFPHLATDRFLKIIFKSRSITQLRCTNGTNLTLMIFLSGCIFPGPAMF